MKTELNLNMGEGWTLYDKVTPIGCTLKEYILNAVKEDPHVAISIGTDSEYKPPRKRKGTPWSCNFYTVIRFEKNGALKETIKNRGAIGAKGSHLIGRVYVKQGTLEGKYPLMSRLWDEVMLTVELAQFIFNETGLIVEIHFDLNPDEQHDSNQMFDTALGFALQAGFPAKCKPDAPTASKGADHFLRTDRKDYKTHKGRKRKMRSIAINL